MKELWNSQDFQNVAEFKFSSKTASKKNLQTDRTEEEEESELFMSQNGVVGKSTQSYQNGVELLQKDRVEEEEEEKQRKRESDSFRSQNVVVCGFTYSYQNDGPKTPTSVNHRIPVTKGCPPAPKKSRIKPPERIFKRKKLFEIETEDRKLLVDSSLEIELFFAGFNGRIKKGRREDGEDS